MVQYPVKLEREGSRILVSFPDFPQVRTYGDDEKEALTRAAETVPAPIEPARGRVSDAPGHRFRFGLGASLRCGCSLPRKAVT